MRSNPNLHYLSFTRKERIGILSLVILILIIFILPTFFKRGPRLQNPQALDQFRAELSALEIRDLDDSMTYDGSEFHKVTKDEKNVASGGADIASSPGNKLFDFDPNEVSSTEWKSLGLGDRTIQTIQHYLAKGGSFKQPSDLLKIYGLKKEDYHRLLPFVKIHLKEQKQDAPFSTIKMVSKPTSQSPKVDSRSSYGKFGLQLLDINKADSFAFISLHGIGPVLANRIIRFREKLGGFYTVDQIGETYGLADSVFQRIKPLLIIRTDTLKKIDINYADVNQLKIHPYIGWKLANAIVQYRLQHGVFLKTNDLLNLSTLSENTFKKLEPYLEIKTVIAGK